MNALGEIREADGLEEYLDALEERLARSVASHPGLVAAVGNEALAAGGKRLRPLLVFLSTPPGREPPIAAGVAVELVHMATLVHDDLIDRAHFRRGKAAAWSVYGADAARATGDYLFARAFAGLCATGDMPAVSTLSDACLALARGEVLQRAQTGDPATTPDQYLERCRLKTGRLFAAAAMLGARFGGLPGDDVARLGAFATALGLAFQIVDDVLDCDGRPDTTGKPLGTDLLDGTITLPLILGARRDPAVAGVIARGAVPEDVLPTLARVARARAVTDARAEAERHADEALAHLATLDGGLDTAALTAVVRGAVDRNA